MAKYDIDKASARYDYKTRSEYETITSKKCKCGHVINFDYNDNNVCRYCGTIHFLNKKAEYKYYLKRRLGK